MRRKTSRARPGDGRRYNPATVRALYPGSFDPVTLGHVDVIARGAALFDELWIAIGRNSTKQPSFTVEERLAQLEAVVADAKLRARVVAFDGLVVDFARQNQIGCLLRGLRSSQDFDYELPMAQLNRKLAPAIETAFVVPTPEHAFISAHLVREAGRHGATLRGLVPECIRAQVEQRLRDTGKSGKGGGRGA